MSTTETVSTGIDALTGLCNIEGFRREANAALKDSAVRNRGLVLVFLDLDDFKIFNRSYGYTRGNEFLQFIADTLRQKFPGALIARLADDHFAVLTFDEDLYRRIRGVNAMVRGYENANTEIKAGIYNPLPEEEPLQACDKARIACDAIKKTYGRIYQRYEESLTRNIFNKRYILDHLDQAIREEWLRVYYQPIIRIATGQLCEAEALCRWQDPSYGLIPPSQFISVLEDAQLIWKLDEFVIEHACKDMAGLREAGRQFVPVSVNLSRRDFDPAICDIFSYAESVLSRYHLSRGDMDIEITESALNSMESVLRSGLADFRRAGYQLWMDDFGSGYSSLNVLKDYDFDTLKIDLRFLQGAEQDESGEKARTILSSIIRMAKELSIQTVCEGVETKAQLELLSAFGCEKAQGYFFARPVPLAELLAMHMDFESRDDRRYADEIGRVNILGLREDSSTKIMGSLPMAVLEYRDGYARPISANHGFLEFLQSIHIDSLGQFETRMNSGSALGEKFAHTASLCLETGQPAGMDFIEHGDYCSARMDRIAVNSESSAFTVLLTVDDTSRTAGMQSLTARDAALRSLYSIYSFVVLYDPLQDTYRTLYRSSSVFTADHDSPKLSESLERFASARILPEEQQRFLEFYKVDRMVRRIRANDSSYRTSWFRTLGEDGGYHWAIYLQLPMNYEGGSYIVSASRTFIDPSSPQRSEEADLLRKLGESGILKAMKGSAAPSAAADAISDSGLLNELLNTLHAGVFWKDEKRRYLGANQYFLDYFGLSLAQLLGQNDEEMGWHVNPEPFQDDELEVLRSGRRISGVIGTCIRKGEARRIKTYKSPIYQDGRIRGLVGYFIDITEATEAGTHVDSLTGALDLEGFCASCREYEDARQRMNQDYACIKVDMDEFHRFNEEYGIEGGDELLCQAAAAIRNAAGTDSVVARIGNDEFVILHQIHGDDLQKLIRHIGTAIAGIHEIHGKPCRVSASLESVIASRLTEKDLQDLLSGRPLSAEAVRNGS